jgi:hypothetical protein
VVTRARAKTGPRRAPGADAIFLGGGRGEGGARGSLAQVC